MILSRPDIEESISSGQIKFNPDISRDQIGEASIDLRLGLVFTKTKQLHGAAFTIPKVISEFGSTGLWSKKILREKDEHGKIETYSLEPRNFILAQTLETVTIPNHLIGFVEGRSSYARFGLSMHQSAPWIQPGWSGNIILEIYNNGENTILLTPIEERPCQLSFFKLTTPLSDIEAYGSRPGDIFQDQTQPFPNKKQ
jgi:dCTP deaminase